MFETMYAAKGVGLAAPQIGSIRLFIVDASPFADEDPDMEIFVKCLLIQKYWNKVVRLVEFNEGCLSIPNLRGRFFVKKIRIRYQDENFNTLEEEYDGTKARIIQHEYDHIEGILFTDYLSVLKERLLRSKLNDISKGKIPG